jgi:hypothetical protein
VFTRKKNRKSRFCSFSKLDHQSKHTCRYQFVISLFYLNLNALFCPKGSDRNIRRQKLFLIPIPYPLSFSDVSIPFASTMLFLLILVLFHSLNAFTASFQLFTFFVPPLIISFYFLLLPCLLLPLLSLFFPPSFLLFALRIWLFLVSFYTLLLPGRPIFFIVTSFCSPFARPFPPFFHGSFLLYLFLAGDGPSRLFLPILNSSTLSRASWFSIA